MISYADFNVLIFPLIDNILLELFTRWRFHQRFTCAFFVRLFCQSQNVTRKRCQNNVYTKKLYLKMLMKLTSWHAKIANHLSSSCCVFFLITLENILQFRFQIFCHFSFRFFCSLSTLILLSLNQTLAFCNYLKHV